MFFMDVNGICAIDATYQNGYDWTGYNSLATKDQDRSPRGVGWENTVTDDVMQNIVATLDFLKGTIPGIKPEDLGFLKCVCV